jgi:hypothetical protein
VDLDVRCNDVKDCKDYSDENNCKIFDIDESHYRKEYPPLTSTQNPTKIEVNMTLLSIGSFQEIEMTFKVSFLISLKWYDSRLTFYNLNKDTAGENNVGHTLALDIWIPRVMFGNSLVETQIKNDGFSFIQVLREGEPTVNSPNKLNANEMYAGAENPFVYKRVYNLDLSCEFDLEDYPMDYQTCYICVRFCSLN